MPKKVEASKKIEKNVKSKSRTSTKKGEIEVKKEPVKVAKKSTSNPKSTKSTSTKKAASRTTTPTKTVAKATTKGASTKRASTNAKSTTKKAVTKKATTSRKTSAKPINTVDDSAAKSMLVEYYDLPYRYNQTIVKILAQTPTTLFVYWDISDDDRNSFISNYGENFFYETYPILIVHNLTHNYSFELEINDFANSWYIRTQEPNCDYSIELGRKFRESNNNQYIYISSSNDIISPNDHVLFESSDLRNVLFKNYKTNEISHKNFGSLNLLNSIDKLYGNIYDIYSLLYDDELLRELSNPSSGEFIRY